MSWTYWVTMVPSDELPQALDDAEATFFGSIVGGPSDEQLEQSAKAKELALELVTVVGTVGPYGVTLTGHANPGHGQHQGYANESVQISVSEVPG